VPEDNAGRFHISRDQARAVKNMSRAELEEFLWTVYQQGAQAGIKDTVAVLSQAVTEKDTKEGEP
jgi:hypothetical protein